MGLLFKPAGQTSWMDELDRPPLRTSSFYLKPWPVRIFEDFPFSLYIVAASESAEGLVFVVVHLILQSQYEKTQVCWGLDIGCLILHLTILIFHLFRFPHGKRLKDVSGWCFECVEETIKNQNYQGRLDRTTF